MPLPIVVEVLLAAALCMWGEHIPPCLSGTASHCVFTGTMPNHPLCHTGSVQLAGTLKPISAMASQECVHPIFFVCWLVPSRPSDAAVMGFPRCERDAPSTLACRGLDAFHFRPDFMSFNHRGHAIPLSVEPISHSQSTKQKKAQ